MKFFSAFAGIGGFDKGILNIIPDAECVGYSEIDRYAQRIYARHYPNHINFGDITRIDERTIPDCDLIVGGFPCQDISIAGKRAGLEGGRSGLFYDLIRIIQEKQPRTILLENVKGLFSSDKGRDFARVLIALDEAGYDVEWENINSKNFGVPQNRERVFIIGHLRGRSWTSVFPLGQSTCNTAESGEQPEDRMVSNCIDSNYYKGADGKRQMICISDSGKGRALEERNIVSPLRANTGAGSNNIIVHCMDGRSPDRPSAKDGGSGHLSRPDGPAYCLTNKVQAIELRQIAHTNPEGSNSMAGRIYDPAGISVTLAGNGSGLGVKTGLYAVPEVAPCIRAEHHNTADVHFIVQTLEKKGINDSSTDINNYVAEKEEHTRKILCILREKIGEEAFEKWEFRVVIALQQKEILQQDLHGPDVRLQNPESKSSVDDCALSCKENKGGRCLRNMWNSGECRYSPHRWGLEKQLCGELAEIMSELSQQSTHAKEIMCSLWKASEGIGLLQQALYPFQETWQSPTQEQKRRIRRLTPLEAERLQGYPDRWTAIGSDEKPVSDSQRYKCLGNSVTVNVIEAIVEKLKETGAI